MCGKLLEFSISIFEVFESKQAFQHSLYFVKLFIILVSGQFMGILNSRISLHTIQNQEKFLEFVFPKEGK